MTYPQQGEIVLTNEQARLMVEILAILTIDQVRDLVESLAQLQTHGHGEVVLVFYRGHPRFIRKTMTEDWLRG